MGHLLECALCAVLLLASMVYRRACKVNQSFPLPPGPPADPIIGHIRMLPSSQQERVFQKWAREYGDVYRLHIAGQSMIILNALEPAIDLLERRSSIYSDRPKCTLLELQGWYPTLTLLPYGPMWRKHRKLIHERFTVHVCPSYEPLQIQEVHVLLKNLLTWPADFRELTQKFSAAVIADITYGHQIVSDDDEFLEFAQQSSNALEAGGQLSSALLDFFPILGRTPQYLRWMPGISGLFEPIRIYNPIIERLRSSTIETVQRHMAAGIARPSIASSSLEAMHRDGTNSNLTLRDIEGAAHVALVGATETTWSTILVFLWAMAYFPEVQKKAHEELDRVVGLERLPDFSDRATLPYVECLLEETMRFHPAVITGVPHRTVRDDIYKGMFIPKGSTVIANIWAMCHDENVYKKPNEFRPERFLPKPFGDEEKHLNAMNFGFGRRICPGRRLAEASAWIAIASILATFDISSGEQKDSDKTRPDLLYVSSLIATPLPFGCKIAPRSMQAETLVKQAGAKRLLGGTFAREDMKAIIQPQGDQSSLFLIIPHKNMTKPVLYTFGLSVWSAVPELAIVELGYPEGAIDIKVVNLVEGANFAPEFLKLNPNATLPTLEADGKVYTTTRDVIRHLVQHAPKKVTPGTVFIDILHEDKYDPNFPLLLARNDEELNATASGFPLVFVQNRQDSLEKHAQLPEAAPFQVFYKEKAAANGGLLAIYKGEVPEATKLSFFAQSAAHWETIAALILKDLPAALPDSGFLGGEEPGEDDFHLGAWLARLASLRGGTVDKDGYKALEIETKQPVPAKVASYWAAWSQRPSWKAVYVNGLH